jgi:Tfp pilus assembly protein PilF
MSPARLLAIGCVSLAVGAGSSVQREVSDGHDAIRFGHYDDAEKLLKSAVTDAAPHSVDAVQALNELARLYRLTAKYDQADALGHQALDIAEHLTQQESLDTAAVLENLGELDVIRGRYPAADTELRRALAIRTKLLGEQSAEAAESMTNLGSLDLNVSRLDEADKLCRRAVEIQDKVLAADDPARADGWDNLANDYYMRARLSDAETMFQKALDLRTQVLGEDHADVGTSYDNFGWLYMAWGDTVRSRRYFRLAAFTRENALGDDHPDTIESQANLAEEADANQAPAAQTAGALEKAVAAEMKILGPDHWETQWFEVCLAQTYQSLKRDADAEKLLKDALDASRRAMGEEQINTANIESSLADFYATDGNRPDAAEKLYKQSLATLEKILGPDDRNVGFTLDSYGQFLKSHDRAAEAAPLLERAQAIEDADKVRNPLTDLQGPEL